MRTVLVAAAVLAAGLILVRLADVVLMAFGAVLTAVLLDAVARPRWPLDEAAARDNPTHLPGRKGAKA